MLIKGKKVEVPEEEILVIPRQGGDVVFKAKTVTDYSDFHKICPVPKPPEIMKPGGIKTQDPNDPAYVKAVDDWAKNKTTWMILMSLSATDDLEWETVDWNKPETWKNYDKELLDSGFSNAETYRLVEIAMTACGLNQKKIDEATERFLADRQAQRESGISQNTVQSTTPSGEPAKDSA